MTEQRATYGNQTGSHNKQKQEYEQWEAMGKEIRRIRNELIKFACKREYQELLTIKLTDILMRAVDQIDKFKCRAEDRMVSRILSPRDDTKWINVFYGGERKEEDGESTSPKELINEL
ncbi:MAG TPA: hypothetical protein DD719_06855 [Desulfotomaculum sp.]|nr:hypothetical protein [Desulfotomaculum sp.]